MTTKLKSLKPKNRHLFIFGSVDESYFGPHRVRGKRGRGAARKTTVFGLPKRGGRVYTGIVPGGKKATLQAIIRGRVSAGAVTHSGARRGYDGLADAGYAKHFRVHHGASELADGEGHVNGVESFRGYAERRLQKFDGVPVATSRFHLKERERRFNHRHGNSYLELLRLLRHYPL